MSSPASSIGKVLGHYRIVEQIGAGGMGVVYRAHDERLRRDVAVKVLAAGTLADDAARKRFHKEALTLSRLNHPNIAMVFDFDSQDGIDFLVTEYISGTTLDAKVAGIALPEKEIVSLATQFSQGLEAAHQSGIIHGDLKPSNLQITTDARVKILDFGLARWMPHASELGLTVTAAETHEHMGTLAYMAPEQFRGASADIRSDIWGVGAVIYEMATGKRPFVEPTDPQLVSAILSKEPNSPRASNRQVSFGLQKIILKALEKDPSRRYQSAGALTADLQRIELGLLPAVEPAQRPLKPAGPNGEQGSQYRVSGLLGGGVVQKAEKLKLEETEKKKYATIIVALVAMVVAIGMGVYAFVEHEQTLRQRALAEELFYSMKAIDLDVANLTRVVEETNNEGSAQEIKKYRERHRLMEKNYDEYLAELNTYSSTMSERDRLVLRISRVFGECEIDMPPGFLEEVNRYIRMWQSSDRFSRAVQLAKDKGYTRNISKELLDAGLPPQFFYLALQESNFETYAVGPRTQKGFAKGIWQFIPEMAVKYGLRLGPMADLNRPDPADDRQHEDLATKAAAKYLKDLYSTDAQASGLLVMASYNWGEDQVLPLVRSMPANPRERNFWKLLRNHRNQIPQETYDYVFSIVAAAVIGENPRLFGFDIDNPLATAE